MSVRHHCFYNYFLSLTHSSIFCFLFVSFIVNIDEYLLNSIISSMFCILGCVIQIYIQVQYNIILYPQFQFPIKLYNCKWVGKKTQWWWVLDSCSSLSLSHSSSTSKHIVGPYNRMTDNVSVHDWLCAHCARQTFYTPSMLLSSWWWCCFRGFINRKLSEAICNLPRLFLINLFLEGEETGNSILSPNFLIISL